MNLVVLGYGYTASRFVALTRSRFDGVVATVRSQDKAAAAARDGVTARILSDATLDPALTGDIAQADALLVSAPPGPRGDPLLDRLGPAIRAAPRLRWIGYLSTIGVYGDRAGGVVDETAPLQPVSDRARARVLAEDAWLTLGRDTGVPVQIFRLAGIYGPGRSPLTKVLEGTAKRIVKPGQVFNRIHVDDIAAVLAASLARPRAGAVYNVSDEEPAPPQDVVTFAAALAGVPAPAEIAFPAPGMSPMARSFYADNKRVDSRLIREELGVTLAYPTYREGLRALAGVELERKADRD